MNAPNETFALGAHSADPTGCRDGVSEQIRQNEFSAEVAQLVEQWSEEPQPLDVRKLLDNSPLIPIFGGKEQWFQ
jgi:hypothetical protein